MRKMIHSFSGLNSTPVTQVVSSEGKGGHNRAIYLLDVTQIDAADNWTVALKFKADSGNTVSIASIATGVGVSGLMGITAVAPFGSNLPFPVPDEVTFTRTAGASGTTFAGKIYMITGAV